MPTVIDEGCLGLPEQSSDDRWKVEKILSGLGFTTDDMAKNPTLFSGGYQVRLNLAKTLVSEPDMLLLDEPTNYLDIISIRWLASFLRQWKGEVILITHDRSFMDSVITHTVGIHRQKIRKIEGTTDKLYQQILKEEEIYEKTRINDEKKRKEVELFISRFRAKARLAGMVQSRVKALEKQQNLDKLENIKNLDFSFNYKPFNAKTIMSVHNLSFEYNIETPIVKDFNLAVRSDDRICVIGKNGKGKTTLLKLLSGNLKPHSGEITMHTNAETGYFAQTNTINLNPNLTIEEEFTAAGCEKQMARNIAGAMMFEGDDALKKIGVLSGGEKSRVLLGKILASPANLLFLDEPTNHLDMESSDALLEAIDDFPGAVIMVTHNEMFLHSLANKFIVFQKSGVSVFEGSYSSFLEKIGWDEENSEEQSGKDSSKKENSTLSKKDARKMRSEILQRRNRELKPLEDRLASVEETIDKKEKELSAKNSEMIDAASSGDSSRISSLSIEIHNLKKIIDDLFGEFEELTVSVENLRDIFESELKSLDN
jgi:ATP-binding cassette subfamily F protein 3